MANCEFNIYARHATPHTQRTFGPFSRCIWVRPCLPQRECWGNQWVL